ncbi:MAG: glycogen synthase GlgA [Thioalkalivibrio sp.]
MRILFASSEIHPLMKTGGLADVSASLPRALKRLRHDVRLVMPAYPQSLAEAGKLEPMASIQLPGFPHDPVRLLVGTLPGSRIPLMLVDAPRMFQRAGDPYRATDGQEWQDNPLRFGLFARLIERLALDQAGLDWRPDVVHCNDWQTGLAPVMLSMHETRPATLFTIHNLAYQGLFPRIAFDTLKLPPQLWHYQGLEFHGQMSFIKGGITFADHITTVSPSYAREILGQQLGNGLDGLLNHRAEVLTGILNGVDYKEWDPRNDRHIVANYGADDLAGKARCKADLQHHFKLKEQRGIPILGHVGRMVTQKGVDLMLQAAEPLLAAGEAQLVIVGSGDPVLEQTARRMAERYPGQMGVHIGYSEPLAHRLEAGADIFVMPSRFEPCGLNQMYSLRYGTVPVVRRTGGLADTVVDADPAHLESGEATGISFEAATPQALADALARALALFHDSPGWRRLMATGMGQDFSWARSAEAYVALYQSLRDSRPR